MTVLDIEWFVVCVEVWKQMPRLKMIEPNGSEHRQKGMEPRTEPWGAPQETFAI